MKKCPKCGCEKFYVTAHVVDEWIVDANGNYKLGVHIADVSYYVKENHPEISVYTEFVAPRWVCRVGDYKTIEEADQAMRMLKKSHNFKEMAILPNQLINITL
mgnify:CR=1 FL=1